MSDKNNINQIKKEVNEIFDERAELLKSIKIKLEETKELIDKLDNIIINKNYYK